MFVISRVCYVLGLLCLGFVVSRVCYDQFLLCLGFVMSMVGLSRFVCLGLVMAPDFQLVFRQQGSIKSNY